MPPTIAPELEAARRRTLDLVADVADADLGCRLHPLMGPLVWDLGHIAAYEDLWLVHRYGERPLLRPDLAAAYDAFETPRAAREDVEILDRAGAYGYLDAVRERTLAVLEERGQDTELHEMVLRHELQHTETMLQAKRLGGLSVPRPAATSGTGLELVDVAGGAVDIGAPTGGFAYDNERPRHRRELAPFRLGRTPVTNATWLSFAEGGGYVRREWWSDEGWAWKQDHDITHHPDGQDGDPAAPVCHVSWFEAEAFANAHAMRLPTEEEWERAGRDDELGLDALGSVWEWTASEFSGYPGFEAHPYREYSEVFFDRGYRVLRGGSCATDPRVATRTFRNWDLPGRRQLFAGLRMAADA
jgi:iron(II)-dependent oxidoreductase